MSNLQSTWAVLPSKRWLCWSIRCIRTWRATRTNTVATSCLLPTFTTASVCPLPSLQCPLQASNVHHISRQKHSLDGLNGRMLTFYPPCFFCLPLAGSQSYEMPMQYATLSRATARPSSLHLSRSKSISNSNPDLATSPVSPDEEVQRIMGSKV